MGLFSKIVGGEHDSDFYDNYNQLKNYAAEIMQYSNATMAQAYKAKEVIPICEDFLAIAELTDKKKALSMMKKEAKAENPHDRMPYHRVFGATVFGRADDWERVIQRVENIHNRFVLWDKKITEFESKYSSLPSHEISLSDEFVYRKKLSDMPEIKYSTITKSFNKDKLVNFIVVDTETTGLKASSGRIVQLSAVKYVDWEATEVWNSLIDPKMDISKSASDINGITNELVSGKPTIKQVAKSFIEFVSGYDVIGYNLPFDLKFLYAEGIDLTQTKRKYYDVLALARKAYKNDLDEFKLIDVAQYNGVYFNPHNSLNDCLATGEVFEKIVNEITNV